MKKEIHFYEYCCSVTKRNSCLHEWIPLKLAIASGQEIINTTQMGMLSTELIELGYRIFVHESDVDFYEIVIGGNNERTNKDLRMAHNLFKMWRANAFRKS